MGALTLRVKSLLHGKRTPLIAGRENELCKTVKFCNKDRVKDTEAVPSLIPIA